MADLTDFESRAEAAMLAAAVGDALGWPQETRSGRVGGRRGIAPQLDFVEWRRRDGGRFANHEEVIRAGEYSDDTQLIAAVARSLLSGDEWWQRLTRLELPTWLLYERGGGGATKRAAQAWTKGSPPWEGESRERYFAAGGNGAAMRVLPHCLRGGTFSSVARSVIADAVTTHGHPRAHIGALAYAHALWRTLRRTDRLPYGSMITDTQDAISDWAQRPFVDVPHWQGAADSGAAGAYDVLWKTTVDEMAQLLTVCADAISQGALSLDDETLKRLGVFSSAVGGAGTVTAAGAIFLASRYAARPEQGLLTAAFARGADTDTLASMTAVLLAAIAGGDWLGGLRERVQDNPYLARLARRVLAGNSDVTGEVPQRDPKDFIHRLTEAEVGSGITLPDGRRAYLRNVLDHPTRSRNLIRTFALEADDGQTLYVKRISKVTRDVRTTQAIPEERRKARVVVALEVSDLERSIRFWRDIAHLDIKRTGSYVNVAGCIALFPSQEHEEARQSEIDFHGDVSRHPRQWIVVFVDPAELTAISQRLDQSDLSIVSVATGERRSVRCFDPEGNLVEFRAPNDPNHSNSSGE